MALDWTAFDLLTGNLVNYYFGTEMALGLGVLFLFLLVLLGGGVEFKYSIFLVLPLLGAYAIGGLLGVNVWVLHVGIIIGGIIYSSAIIKVMS